MTTSVPLVTADALDLEAELSIAAPERARMVLCHPHPQQGGTMQSLVISELFTALPQSGITCLRFNFRGVGASNGTHDHGDRERLDVQAAIAQFVGVEANRAVPVVVAGWSFGADLALSVHDTTIAGWIGIAPPLRYTHDLDAVAQDLRPKLVVLGERDEVRDAQEVHDITRRWTACTTEVIPGASHFFVGRTEAITRAVLAWVDRTILR